MRRLKQPGMRWRLPAGILALVVFVLVVLVRQISYKQGAQYVGDWYSKPRLVEPNLGELLAAERGLDEVWSSQNEETDVEEKEVKSWKERLRGFSKPEADGLAGSSVLERKSQKRDRNLDSQVSGLRIPRVWTVICVSDTGGRYEDMRLPDGDVLIHAGGFTLNGTTEELIDFNEWLGVLPHRYKILVPGGVDLGPPPGPQPRLRGLLSNANAILVDSTFVLPGGVVIYGAAAPPPGSEESALGASKWDFVPLNIDILVTHGQPSGSSDLALIQGLVGSPELAEAIERTRPRLVVLGHVHQPYGLLRQVYCRRRGWLRSCPDGLEEVPLAGGPLRIEQPSDDSPTGSVYFLNAASVLSRVGSKGSVERRQSILIEVEEEDGPASAGLAAWVHNRGQGPGWTEPLPH